MSYTAFDNSFEKASGAPTGDKDVVFTWMKNRFPGLKEKASPADNADIIEFYDGTVMAYDTDDDGEVYLVSSEDADGDFFSDFENEEESESVPTIEVGEMKYTLKVSDVDGGLSIDGIDPLPTGDFVLPSEVSGKSVVQLGKQSFRNALGLVSVDIPDTVLAIPGQVFYGAFSGCSKLKRVKLSANLKEIGSGTFGDCVALESIELPDSVEKIGSYAFEGAKALKSVKMPNGLSIVNSNTFGGCSALIRVELQEGLESVFQEVFKDCTSLKEVVFPATFDPADLGMSVFEGCTGLERVVFSVPCPEDFDEAGFREGCFTDSPSVQIVFAGGDKKMNASGV